MKHTEQQIAIITKKLLEDIKREYFTHLPLQIVPEHNPSYSSFGQLPSTVWIVKVPVQEEQFQKNEPDYVVLIIDDETEEITGYLDGGGGRPVPMCAKKDPVSGKYKLDLK